MQKTLTPNSPTAPWFDNLVGTIRSHELQIETNTAPEEIKNFYNSLASGNEVVAFKMAKDANQQFFVGRILVDYVALIKEKLPLKLAFDYNDSEVLVWAEIEADNERLEKELFIAEAKINSKYHSYGYSLSTTIVEDSDYLSIPAHYRQFR